MKLAPPMVRNHLQATDAKLGVSGKAELARVLAMSA